MYVLKQYIERYYNHSSGMFAINTYFPLKYSLDKKELENFVEKQTDMDSK